MLVLTLRKNLTVQGKLPSDLKDFCHHHLVFSNPVYDNFVKIKRFKPDWIAKYIVAYSLRGDTIVLPRGIFDQFGVFFFELIEVRMLEEIPFAPLEEYKATQHFFDHAARKVQLVP